MNYYVYVLQSHKDGFMYTGFTSNMNVRLKQHKDSKVIATKYRLPIVLVYYEVCKNEKDARVRERYLKSGLGYRYIRNRLKNYFSDQKDDE